MSIKFINVLLPRTLIRRFHNQRPNRHENDSKNELYFNIFLPFILCVLRVLLSTSTHRYERMCMKIPHETSWKSPIQTDFVQMVFYYSIFRDCIREICCLLLNDIQSSVVYVISVTELIFYNRFRKILPSCLYIRSVVYKPKSNTRDV